MEVFDHLPLPSLPSYQSPYLPHDSNSSLMIKFSKHENIWMNTLHYEYEKNNLIDERLEIGTSSALMITQITRNMLEFILVKTTQVLIQ